MTPPFNKAFAYKPEQIIVYESGLGKKTYLIVFSKNKGICSSHIFQELYLSFFCKDVIRFSTNKSQISSPYRKDEVLALINFLLEKIEDKENIKKLEKIQRGGIEMEAKSDSTEVSQDQQTKEAHNL